MKSISQEELKELQEAAWANICRAIREGDVKGINWLGEQLRTRGWPDATILTFIEDIKTSGESKPPQTPPGGA